MVAGGPAASLLLAGLAWAALWRAGPAGDAASALALWTALVSLLVGVATLLPAGAGGAPTGGAQLRELLRAQPGDGTVELRAVRMLAWTRRPRDWDAALLEAALSAATSADARRELMAYEAAHAEDVGDHARAHESLTAAARLGSAPSESAVLAQLALHEILWHRDPSRARAWVADLGPAAEGEHEVAAHAVRAALAFDRGDLAAARGALVRARRARDAAPLPVRTVCYVPALDALDRRLSGAPR